MERTLNDFLSEINQIAPLKIINSKTGRIGEWKECFDAKSGFAYYWNTKTNEVTWTKPDNFVSNSNVNSPASTMLELKDKIKIYKLAPTKSLPKSNENLRKVMPEGVPGNKRPHSDSEDEKITLITSYGSSSGSEDENEPANESPSKPQELQEEDILSTVLKRAQQLKERGNVDPKKIQTTQSDIVPKMPKPIEGFSLVPGYDSNSEDDSESEQFPETNHSSTPLETQTHSTLFPIMKAPNISDFETKQDVPEKEVKLENSFDMKNFKRKRRLGVNFMPNRNPAKPPSPDGIPTERKGFGFKEHNGEVTSACSSNTLYSNFTKGGVEFVKPEENSDVKKEEMNEIDEKKIVEIYEVLHEKLRFLCEGNGDVTPVQIILIQIETLYGALKAESLNPDYLYDWLEGTSEDLIKLETAAAPEGWTLQWDRLQKRYFYQNKESGQTQWEFPQTETESQEDAMDICTTPPPAEVIDKPIEEQENIPSPPPAPIISKSEPDFVPEHRILPDVPSGQPLPPGVDYVESTSHRKNDIDSAFNSFYSELAEIEKVQPNSPTNVTEQTDTVDNVEEPVEPPKKKKKKVKIAQGSSLKKKEYSKLVEKWKNVQNNY